MTELPFPAHEPVSDVSGSETPRVEEYPPNVLGASAIILSVVGIFFVLSFGVASLLGIGLGIGSLVRSRRHRAQTGGVGIAAIILGVVGLGVTSFVLLRYFATLN